MIHLKFSYSVFFFLTSLIFTNFCFSQIKKDSIDEMILELMKEGDIPGLSLVFIDNGKEEIKTYGYANLENQIPVTAKTLFEMGSCSKAFTALAISNLVHEHKIDLDAPVSTYIPWFNVTYKAVSKTVTVRQLLHHTSGIPWNTISKIPELNNEDALETTVRTLINQELNNSPGTQYEYATINYDVLALIIQNIVNESFEKYLQENIINDLGLHYTTLGVPRDNKSMATGYKISFFAPREYLAPVFRGNFAAGYIISNAEDMAKWLKFQMGLANDHLYELAKSTHSRDRTVPLHGMSSYAWGWDVSLDGSGEIYHAGLNPNYTAYVAFRPDSLIGVAVLSNSNSRYTAIIGNNVMKLMAGEGIENEFDPGNDVDRTYSSLSLALAVYILVVITFLGMILGDWAKGTRKYKRPAFTKFRAFAFSLLVVLPCLYGLYIVPEAIAGFSWGSMLIWMPISFEVMIKLILVAIGITYFSYFFSLYFPEENKFKRVLPQLLLLSVLSGLANAVVIIMVTSALNSQVELKYLIFYYALAVLVYLSGRKFVQINIIKLARGLIYDLRIKLTEKIFSTSYHRFEAIDRGRVYTALNDDVGTIGESTNTIVLMATSIITVAGAFVYLASLAFWATMLTLFLIVTLAMIYFFVGKRANVYFEAARDARNVYMGLINGMIDGFKEISLSRNKKLEYKEDVALSAEEDKNKTSTADIKFVNAFLVGESLLILLLGAVSFAIPEMFPNIKFHTIMSFVVILLYLIGPINGILGSVPGLMRLRVAWNRLQEFLKEIPANLDLNANLEPIAPKVRNIIAKGLKFTYKNTTEKNDFQIGAIDLEIGNGQILFIIGGNGSGKTTLAKLLTGLYHPDEGQILINGNQVSGHQLSEYFSAVFSPAYLFEKLYNVDTEGLKDKIGKYLKILDLSGKVEIKDNKYSTLNLSGGQRKRLALLQCYLEDSPIYLFDEWAADQDPSYRKFFYRTLLPEMKKMNKIIIAITHDDHYFDVADKVLKMDQGKLDVYRHQLTESSYQ